MTNPLPTNPLLSKDVDHMRHVIDEIMINVASIIPPNTKMILLLYPQLNLQVTDTHLTYDLDAGEPRMASTIEPSEIVTFLRGAIDFVEKYSTIHPSSYPAPRRSQP